MTQTFDQHSVAYQKANPLLWDELSIPKIATVREIILRPATPAFARPYIARYHYSHLMPDSTVEVFAGWCGTSLAGIICYGVGAQPNQFSSVLPYIRDGEYRELTRLWSPDGMPKNTESHMISQSIKMLTPQVHLLVSYADESQGHRGTIYQATNWYYLGRTSGGTSLIDSDGRVRHSKSINIYRLRHPELKNKTTQEIMEIYGWKSIPASPKHKYVLFRGSRIWKRRAYEQVKNQIKPYPKSN